jgi:hypothetical protein
VPVRLNPKDCADAVDVPITVPMLLILLAVDHPESCTFVELL